MKVKIEDVEYSCVSVLDISLKDYNKILDIVNKYKDDVDIQIETLSLLTDIPIDILDICDLVKIHKLYNKLTNINKEDIKLINEIKIGDVIYKTSEEFKSIDDIKLNRTQRRVIKEYADSSDYIASIVAVFFTINGDKIINNDDDLKERIKLFKDNVKIGDVIPYIFNVINTVAILTGEIINDLNDKL